MVGDKYKNTLVFLFPIIDNQPRSKDHNPRSKPVYDSEVPTRLVDLMFGATLLIAVVGLKTFYAAWICQEKSIISNGVFTQRQRYTFLSLATTICWGPPIYLVIRFGWTDFRAGISEWLSVGVIGPLVAVLMWFGLFSPVLTLVSFIHIYRHPSQMAYRVRGGWIRTIDVRQRVSPKPIYNKITAPIRYPGNGHVIELPVDFAPTSQVRGR